MILRPRVFNPAIFRRSMQARIVSQSAPRVVTGFPFPLQTLTSTAPGQWFVDDVVVEGETGSTYVVRAGDIGKSVRCANSNALLVRDISQISGLSAWHRFDVGVLRSISPDTSAGDGDNIARWLDHSGNGRHLNQTDNAKRLAYWPTHGGVVQPATTGNTDLKAAFGFDRRSFSAFFIIKPTTLNNLLANGSAFHTFLSANNFNFHYSGSAGAQTLSINDGSFRSSTVRITSSLGLVGIMGSATEIRMVYNDLSGDIAPTSAGTITSMDLLNALGSGFSVGGLIKDFILFNRSLTGADLQLVRDYSQARGVFFARDNHLVIEGDSISAGYTATANRDWVTQSQFEAMEHNYSLGGRTAQTMRSEARATAIYNGSKRNILVIFCGTNDLFGGRTGAQAWSDISTYATARRAQGYRVVLVGMLPRNGLETQRQALNSAMRTNWATCADAFADVETLPMGAAGANNSTVNYDPDTVHPNLAGHTQLANLIKPLVVSQMV